MKKLALILLFTIGMAITVSARSTETVTLRAGNQKTAKSSRLKVKFVAVTEDSRCPMGAMCIWEGNARIKVEITGRHEKTRTVEFNTTMGPKEFTVTGWTITLDSLTPMRRAGHTDEPLLYRAKFTITRL